MKILLLYIYPGRDIKRYTCLGLACLKAYALKSPDLKDKVEITIKNIYKKLSSTDMLQQINEIRPDVIGIGGYMWNIDKVLHLCEFTKALLPNVYIILGGPEVSPLAEKILQNNNSIDIIVRGAGEKPFTDIIRNLLNGVPEKENIQGITYRKNNSIVSIPEGPPINLDEIPSVYRSGLVPEAETNKIDIWYETSRGCRSSCAYCLMHNNTFRMHSIERIKKDLLYFMENQYLFVRFADANLNYDSERLNIILDLISKNNRSTKFCFGLRAALLSKKNIDSLNRLANNAIHRITMPGISIGLQSINPKTRGIINRHENLKKIISNISLFGPALKECSTIDLMFGLPGDNYTGFKESVEFTIQKLGIKNISQFRLSVFPGTTLYNNADKYDLIFDPLPPHNAYSNFTYSYNEIQRSKDLCDAFNFFRRNVFLDTVIKLSERLNLRIVDILEHFSMQNTPPFPVNIAADFTAKIFFRDLIRETLSKNE